MTSWSPEVQEVLDQEREVERMTHEMLGDAPAGPAAEEEEDDAYVALETSAEEVHEIPRMWGTQNALF